MNIFNISDSDSDQPYVHDNQPYINCITYSTLIFRDLLIPAKTITTNTFKYQLDDIPKAINEQTLQQKIKTLIQNNQIQMHKPNPIDNHLSDDLSESSSEEPKKARVNRYFNHQEIICYNCREYGHKQYHCPFDTINYCLYCLSLNHTQNQCPQQITLDQQSKCQLCSKIGHSTNNCINQLKFDFAYISTQILSRIVCINCQHLGHINCGNIKEDNIYS